MTDEIKNFFWYPDPYIIQKLSNYLDTNNITDKIIDVGCGPFPFVKATHFMDFNDENNVSKIDLDFDTFPYSSAYFNFAYCRHTIEDIQNPQNAFKEIVRTSKSGYIETPSPIVECIKGITNKCPYRGYIHHRYIVWSDYKTNTLYFLPKYPYIEYCIDDNKLKSFIHLLNNYPVYWNNYYIWDEKNKPNIFVYRNDVNFKIIKEYHLILNKAIDASMEYTDNFKDKLLY